MTPRRVIKQVGIHQRFDTAAFRMIERYLPAGGFPGLKEIISFEGYNGPDGLNTKIGLRPKGINPDAPDEHNPSHLYDPSTDTGEVPERITIHYAGLVDALKATDLIRASFEASWLAHYVCDGLTPAHHWPLEEKLAEAAAKATKDMAADTSRITTSIKKNWALWGVNGHMSTHFYFETGIAFSLLTYRIRPVFSDEELAKARRLGPLEYFKDEARDIAALNLYDRFYRESWTAELMTIVKNKVAPQTARTIGIMWLLALLEAGEQLATDAPAGKSA